MDATVMQSHRLHPHAHPPTALLPRCRGLELTQLLYAAQHVNRAAAAGRDGRGRPAVTRSGPPQPPPLTASWEEIVDACAYKPTHTQHPTAQWVRRTPANYRFAAALATALVEEYTHRFGTVIAIAPHVAWLQAHEPPFPSAAAGGGGSGNSGSSGAGAAAAGNDDDDDDGDDDDDDAGATSSSGNAGIGTASNSSSNSSSSNSSSGEPLSQLAPEGTSPGCTPFPLAMPEYLWSRNAVEAYRRYYQVAKAAGSKYTKRDPPPWLTLHVPGDPASMRLQMPVETTVIKMAEAADKIVAAAARNAARVGSGSSASSSSSSSGSASAAAEAGGGAAAGGAAMSAAAADLAAASAVALSSTVSSSASVTVSVSGRKRARGAASAAAASASAGTDAAAADATTGVATVSVQSTAVVTSSKKLKKGPAPVAPQPDKRVKFLANRSRVPLDDEDATAGGGAGGSDASGEEGHATSRSSASGGSRSSAGSASSSGGRRVWIVMGMSEQQERARLAAGAALAPGTALT